ncbi:UDP-glucose 4-epimerase GalE [Sulfurirhabdus autotrophica]|uniref:UDP-glucose 4-epimerase n=1 Tax=Sulfurirhabdus autotrophica TaxID=1706046 RepID=A0A4R3XUQ0_9PROT|nr:UDP-glucose 4-epimerase GalE [Sulfurirhabdus autotrophica]TCV83425.1 UDP-galactose 4-epimerase [Sulfurirhabdus autotrophica]
MSENRKILITGGAGYIGSHTCLVLLEAGLEVAVVDNLCNSSREALRRVETITGKKVSFYDADVRDAEALPPIFEAEKPQAVIHFAGLKAVGESVEKPLEYYDTNISGTLTLLEAMRAADVRQIVFSSSATVYGNPATVPIHEDFPLSATNPYGRSKLIIEDVMRDLVLSDPSWKVALLRYFNPVGAHESGLIGEDPNGIPNNLMPFVSQVAVGRRPHLSIFGGDYPTPDGTGVRDYIHVVDLAKGHWAALQALKGWEGNQPLTVNLGTGQGYSVLDMVRAFEKASCRNVPYKIVERRSGDIAACYAAPALAERLLGWKAEFGVDKMCEDTWRWQVNNPKGYA